MVGFYDHVKPYEANGCFLPYLVCLTTPAQILPNARINQCLSFPSF